MYANRERQETTLLADQRYTSCSTLFATVNPVRIFVLLSLHVTSRLDRDKHGRFFSLGKRVQTNKTMVVDGRDQKPLALLRLGSGPPLNAAMNAVPIDWL